MREGAGGRGMGELGGLGGVHATEDAVRGKWRLIHALCLDRGRGGGSLKTWEAAKGASSSMDCRSVRGTREREEEREGEGGREGEREGVREGGREGGREREK